MGGLNAQGVARVAAQPTRQRILGHLRLRPGDHFRSIVNALDLSVGTTRHHLRVLIRNGMVRMERQVGKCRYFLPDGGLGTSSNSVVREFWQMQELRIRVWFAVTRLGDGSPSAIAHSLGISRQLAHYHLVQLAALGLVGASGGRYRPIKPLATTSEVSNLIRSPDRPRRDSPRAASSVPRPR